MKTKYVLWDPGSHEHLVRFNKRSPKRSRWKFLDSDTFLEKDVETFPSIKAAQRAAKAIMKATVDEFCQLEVVEVRPALAQTTRFIPRIDNPNG